MVAVPSPASPVKLRLATAGDFGAYMDAFEAVAAEGRWMGAEAPIDREGRRAGFDRAVAGDGAVLFVAETGGEIVGAAYSSVGGGVADLGMFVVAGRRGSGVGAALLEAVIAWAREQRAHKVSLAAWPTNYAAIGLYARYGFLVEGTRRRHYRRRSGALWDSVVMGLVLDEESLGGPARGGRPRGPIVVPEGGLAVSGPGFGAGADGLVLREWSRHDVPVLMALVDDPAIRRWLDVIPDPYTSDDAEEYVAGARVGLTAGTGAALAVVAGGRPVGSVGLRIDSQDSGIAEIGYWVGSAARGRGVASAAARVLSEFGLGPLGLRRVELNAALANAASRRVAENAGFEPEGVRRAWRMVGGVPADFAVFSRVADGDHERGNAD